MEEKCGYCIDDDDNLFLYDEQGHQNLKIGDGKTVFDYSFGAYINNRKQLRFESDTFGTPIRISVDIKYCPMCGRKL